MKFQSVMPSECGRDWGDRQEDRGSILGYLRGYNLEMKNKSGDVDYASMVCIYGQCDDSNPDFMSTIQLCDMNGWTPTGRAIFRGYYTEEYDEEGRDYYVNPVSDEEVLKVLLHTDEVLTEVFA